MTEPEPHPKVSNRLSPLAIIIGIALVVMVVIAFVGTRGLHHTPKGANVPLAGDYNNEVMPKQSAVPNTPAPMANTNDAVEAQPSDKNIGGLDAHSGPANTTGQ